VAVRRRTLIMGAAGRDFHDFNVAFRADADVEVVAFTTKQIPYIEDRWYPAELAGPHYPLGIPIHPEDELTRLIGELKVQDVVFAYSDVSHDHVMHRASQVLAAGANFVLLGPASTMLRASVPVVAVCATRTGAGKSQTARYVAALLRDHGLTPVVVRHPLPYGDLAAEQVQRFARLEDLDLAGVTIEERGEYEHHLNAGTVVYAGVDYGEILDRAQQECDVLLWDGGNNFPFYAPDLMITVADPLRAGDELHYHPGETNLRMADVIIVNKTDVATPSQIAELRRDILELNPRARVITATSLVTIDRPEEIRGKRVLVVEDGPTLTHGGMKFGAGVTAARSAGAAEIVDPRPWALGTIEEVLGKYDVGPVLPAEGYSPQQLEELDAVIGAVDADLVVIATPIDLRHVLRLTKPAVRVTYELREVEGGFSLQDALAPITGG
jgi:predicted GTPase